MAFLGNPLIPLGEDNQVRGPLLIIDDEYRFNAFASGVAMVEGDAPVEQENFELLGAVWKKQDVDAGMAACRAVEHRAGEIGRKRRQAVHQIDGAAPQEGDALDLFILLVDGLVLAHGRLDIGVAGQRETVRQAQLANRLALGEAIIEAVLGDQARGGVDDLGTQGGGVGVRNARGAIASAHDFPSRRILAHSIRAPFLFMHIHILGICGTFMGGIALIASAAGHRVTGCDANVYPPMSSQLEAEGVDLVEGYGADQLALNADLWVVGNAVSRGNPLLEAILARGLPYISGPQWLAENILQGKWVLAVAGTHGKTTAAAMLAWILEHAGLQPGFLIGGVPQNFKKSANFSESSFFVVEADEYDTAFCDKRSKFVHYHPRTAVLNNLEFDHADIFADLAAIETQFHHFVRTIPGNGLLVANAAEPALERVLERGCWTPVERFNSMSGWHATGDDASGHLVIWQGEREMGAVNWQLAGEHNRNNSLAALLAARHAGVPLAHGLAALACFENVKRRLEVRGTVNGVTVYDDFAHHPTAIATTLAGLRGKVGQDKGRILAVLEPRSNTMKLGAMKDALAGSLMIADQVFCYCAKLGWDAGAALAPLGDKAAVSDDLAELVAQVVAAARPGDQVLVMSNGGFGGIHEKLLAALAVR